MAKVVPKIVDRLGGVPSNVWLGTSVESAEHLDRVAWLRATPSAVRFLSLEPLLGPLPDLNLADMHWVIVGGESGPIHRPIDPAWVRGIRDQCLAEGVAFFFKQWGGRTPKAGGRLLDKKTWDQFPPDVIPHLRGTETASYMSHGRQTSGRNAS
jgi:protein gp37